MEQFPLKKVSRRLRVHLLQGEKNDHCSVIPGGKGILAPVFRALAFFSHLITLHMILALMLSPFSPFVGYGLSASPHKRVVHAKQEQVAVGTTSEEIVAGIVNSSTELLLPIAARMNNALAVLHSEYPIQLHFYDELFDKLPREYPERHRIERLVQQARSLFLYIVSYFDVLQRTKAEIDKGMKQNGRSSFDDRFAYNARLRMIVSAQEKIGFYEIVSQGLLIELFQLMSGYLDKQRDFDALKKLASFEKLRQAQIAKYFEERKSFDSLNELFFALERVITDDIRLNLLVNAFDHLDLAYSLSFPPSSSRGGQSASFRSDILLHQELKRIAEKKSEEFESINATLSDNFTGRLWSILYFPQELNKTRENPDDQFYPSEIAGYVAESLDSMRPVLQSLAAVLKERNKALGRIPLLQKEGFSLLHELISLEYRSIENLEAVLSAIRKQKSRSIKVSSDFLTASLYEELGYLNEEIMSLEFSINWELSRLARSSNIISNRNWGVVKKYIRREKQLLNKISLNSAEFKNALDKFKYYQVSVVERYSKALRAIDSDLNSMTGNIWNSGNPLAAEFIDLVKKILRKKLKDAESLLFVKKEMMNLEESDPLFAAVFGFRTERFWHDHRGQGLIFYEMEHLISKRHQTIANLLALCSPNSDRRRQAFLLLRVADDLDIIQHLGKDEKGFFSVIGYGDNTFRFEGLADDYTRQSGLHTSPKTSRISWRSFPWTIWSLLTAAEVSAALPQQPKSTDISLFQQLKKSTHDIFHKGSERLFGRKAMNAADLATKQTLGEVVAQIKKNTLTYAVIGGGTAIVCIACPPATPVMITASKTALDLQLGSDIAIGSARAVAKAIPDPKRREQAIIGVNGAEIVYNVTKTVQGYLDYRKARTAYDQSLIEPTKTIDKAAERIYKCMGDAADEQASFMKRAEQILTQLRDDPTLSPSARKALESEASKLYQYATQTEHDSIELVDKLGEANKVFMASEKALSETRMVKRVAESSGALTSAETGIENTIDLVNNVIASIAKDDTRQKAEKEAVRKAVELALKKKAEEKAQIQAEEEAAKEKARIEAEKEAKEKARIQAEEEAAKEKARIEAEKEAKEKARIEAEKEAKEKARIEAEKEVKKKAARGDTGYDPRKDPNLQLSKKPVDTQKLSKLVEEFRAGQPGSKPPVTNDKAVTETSTTPQPDEYTRPPGGRIFCRNHTDCPQGEACTNGRCAPPGKPTKAPITATTIPAPPSNKGTGGLSDVTVNRQTITISVWDHGIVDNDIINIMLNGAVIPGGGGVVLTKSPKVFTLKLNPGRNVISIYAVNEGKIKPNTASIKISNVTSGKAEQAYSINQKTSAQCSATVQ